MEHVIDVNLIYVVDVIKQIYLYVYNVNKDHF